MKFVKLIKVFRRILMRQVKAELKHCSSLDGSIDNATIDILKAIYAAYHGLESVEAIEDSDMIQEWACNTLDLIQRGLAE